MDSIIKNYQDTEKLEDFRRHYPYVDQNTIECFYAFVDGSVGKYWKPINGFKFKVLWSPIFPTIANKNRRVQEVRQKCLDVKSNADISMHVILH